VEGLTVVTVDELGIKVQAIADRLLRIETGIAVAKWLGAFLGATEFARLVLQVTR
jgi:hypothetical protein